MVLRILAERPGITAEHLAWLFFAALQRLTSFSYDHVLESEASQLEAQLRRDIAAHEDSIVDLCMRKNCGTNIVNRYAALQIIIALMNAEAPLKVLDIGCSLGLGLMAINTPFIRKVRISDPLLDRALSSKVPISALTGLDVQERDLDWSLSCYLPQYKKQRSEVAAMFTSLSTNGTEINFVLGDALRLISSVPEHYYDIIWTSNTCYEVEGPFADIETGIRAALKSKGAWLYGYYRSGHCDTLQLPFRVPEWTHTS